MGSATPSVPAYDRDFENYSWMVSLARADFDVFALIRAGLDTATSPTNLDHLPLATDGSVPLA